MRYVEMTMLFAIEDGIDETIVVGHGVAEALSEGGYGNVIDVEFREMVLEPKGKERPMSEPEWRENIAARLELETLGREEG